MLETKDIQTATCEFLFGGNTMTCFERYDCCSCGGNDCGCRYCFDCNACDTCKNKRDCV